MCAQYAPNIRDGLRFQFHRRGCRVGSICSDLPEISFCFRYDQEQHEGLLACLRNRSRPDRVVGTGTGFPKNALVTVVEPMKRFVSRISFSCIVKAKEEGSSWPN
jgi:hypothetical protein